MKKCAFDLPRKLTYINVIDNTCQLETKFYDIRDDCIFFMIKSPFQKITTSPVHEAYIRLIQYSRALISHNDYHDLEYPFTSKTQR